MLLFRSKFLQPGWILVLLLITLNRLPHDFWAACLCCNLFQGLSLPPLGSWWLCPWLPFALWLQIYHETQLLRASAELPRHADKAALCLADIMVMNVIRRETPQNPATATCSGEREKTQIIRRGQGSLHEMRLWRLRGDLGTRSVGWPDTVGWTLVL